MYSQVLDNLKGSAYGIKPDTLEGKLVIGQGYIGYYYMPRLSATNMNVYKRSVSTDEMKKLLGLEKELFYVRDGIVNKYARRV